MLLLFIMILQLWFQLLFNGSQNKETTVKVIRVSTRLSTKQVTVNYTRKGDKKVVTNTQRKWRHMRQRAGHVQVQLPLTSVRWSATDITLPTTKNVSLSEKYFSKPQGNLSRLCSFFPVYENWIPIKGKWTIFTATKADL